MIYIYIGKAEPICQDPSAEICPLQGNCLDKGIVYQATVTAEDNSTMNYIGSAATTFKDRWYNHRSSFIMREKEFNTALSAYVWSKKDAGLNPIVTYSTLTKAEPYSASRGKCYLCLQEKVHILLTNQSFSLNKRLEISSKCRHKYKHSLAGWKPG